MADRTARNSRRNNLPADLSSFIGRQRETSELVDLLGTNRLITLIGAGGVGKTRLALHAAAELERTYGDGAYIVEFASIADPALVVGAVALVLGVHEQPDQSLIVTLAEALQNKHLLLVPDNCEHLVSAVADLAGHLLRTCPRLRILTTSRAALGCNGEVTLRVPSLSLATHEPGSSLSLAEVEHSEAGETRYDPSLPAARPPLLVGPGMSPFAQRGLFPGEPESARLQGYLVDRPPEPGARTTAVVFSAHGRSYEIGLRYPVGLAAAQPLLDSYASIVEGFRLDAPPEPTPVPVKQALVPGPFLSQQEALTQASARASGPLDLVEARLVPEAEARRVPGPCRGFFAGHPDGVWLLTVREAAADGAPTRLVEVDATTGEQLCSQPVDLQANPPPLGRASTATPAAGERQQHQRMTCRLAWGR